MTQTQTPPTPGDAAIRAQMALFRAGVGVHLHRGQPFALLDIPEHGNIGDSAIHAGELAFFDAHAGRRADCVCTWNADLDWLERRLPPEGPVFLHGGGNFGDLWMNHQTFRHAVLRRFRDRKIVQLPQSIHYRDPAGIAETARLIAAHGDFTLLVRDRPSLDLARRHFDCDAALCPDAAMMLWRLDPGAAPQADLLVALRDDIEAVQDEARAWLKSRHPAADWVNVDVWTLPVRAVWKLVRSLPDNRLGMIWREVMYRRQSRQRVMAGARQLGGGRRIVTDRLHMHLIATLIRRPHVVLDNSYGKIARYIDAFGRDDLTVQVSSLEELQRALAS